MKYKLTRTTDNKVITSSLKSFWLYASFSVHQDTGQIEIGPSYAAFDYSEASMAFKNKKPNEFQFPPIQKNKDDETPTQDYEITDGDFPFELRQTYLLKSYKAEYANEVKWLDLLTFEAHKGPETWLNDRDYRPGEEFEPPLTNQDNNPFQKRQVSFQHMKNRYAFSAHQEQDRTGISSIFLTLPFLKDSFISNILATQKAEPAYMPILTVNTNKAADWAYFSGKKGKLPGNINGFVMVCQGAFKLMDLNLYLAEWLQGCSFVKNQQTILRELVRLTHNSSRFTRTIETVDITNDNAVYPGSDDGPVEILYLDGLNSKTNVVVPPILVV